MLRKQREEKGLRVSSQPPFLHSEHLCDRVVEIQPLLGTEPALLELPARGINIAAAGVADGCLHAMHGESTLERFDFLDG